MLLFNIFLQDLRTVQTVWYFVVFLQDLRTVQTVWYSVFVFHFICKQIYIMHT